jgi:Icc-related predicted phosphoesterase
LGREPLQVSGVWFVGLGGSPPGILENQVYFEGNPYANAEECDLSIQNNLLPQLTPSKYILVTHFPPYDIGYLNSKGNIVSAGNAKLQEVIFEKSPNIILYVYGHLHTQYNNDNFGGVNALNPGSVIFGQYALVTLTLGESWEVKEISLKSL